VFITGASSGIGRALALCYASRGVPLGLAARRQVELEEVQAQVRALGGTAFTYLLDVRDAAATREVLRMAHQDLGGLHTVVANAGVATGQRGAAITWEAAEPVLDINVKGAFCTIISALPYLREAGAGHIVGVSSLAGRAGLPSSSVYSASKAALTTFLQALRVELKDHGVDVSDVQAGFVKTPMTEKGGFTRPFEWSAEHAATFIADQLEKRPAIVEFQFPLTLITGAARVMPRAIFDRVVPFAMRKMRKPTPPNA
jgi:short-subunit dehydrogenase